MSKSIRRRQKARQDLVDVFRYYAREAGFRVAQLFLAQAEATFTRLAGMPGTGIHYEHEHPRLQTCVSFPSPASENTLSSTDPWPTALRLFALCTVRATFTTSSLRNSALRKTLTTMKKQRNQGPEHG
jgi:plasmid stabilization system protein ParE